jgi:hypothetical protein
MPDYIGAYQKMGDERETGVFFHLKGASRLVIGKFFPKNL